MTDWDEKSWWTDVDRKQNVGERWRSLKHANTQMQNWCSMQVCSPEKKMEMADSLLFKPIFGLLNSFALCFLWCLNHKSQADKHLFMVLFWNCFCGTRFRKKSNSKVFSGRSNPSNEKLIENVIQFKSQLAQSKHVLFYYPRSWELMILQLLSTFRSSVHQSHAVFSPLKVRTQFSNIFAAWWGLVSRWQLHFSNISRMEQLTKML